MKFTSLDNFLQFSTFRLFKFTNIRVYQTVKMEINDIDTFVNLQKGQKEWNFRKTAHQNRKINTKKEVEGNITIVNV